jgi:hypothetical protein
MKRIERIPFAVNNKQAVVDGRVGTATAHGAIRAVSGCYPLNPHVLFDSLRLRA